MAVKIFNIQISLTSYGADPECFLVRKTKASRLDAFLSRK